MPISIVFQGDYTRTGERKISGMMKDGMNSANRFVDYSNYLIMPSYLFTFAYILSINIIL